MQDEAAKILQHHRALINQPTAHAINETLSPDFFAVFDLGNGQFETYTYDQYQSANIEAYNSYQGQDPYWDYETLDIGVRSEEEFVVSSRVNFTLGDRLVMKALCMEVFRKEEGDWRLLRQYMEKFRP